MFELEAYERTRSVGLPWLHHIPEHWRIARAKTVMSAIDVRSATGEEELLTVSSSRGVIPRSSASVSMFKAESYVGHKLCWPGDLVINSLWAWGRGLGVARDHGIVSTAYGVYRQREQTLDPAYLDHLVRSEPFRWELQVRSQGVWKSRLQMTDARWLDAPLLIPPADEQAAIVKYLAHANARIDKAIAAKRRLLALLDEQEMAEVSRIVLGGTDAGERKPSGIAWVGSVPVNWHVAPLRARYRQDLGKMLSDKVIDGEHLRPYLRNTDVQWNRINTVDLPLINIRPEEVDRYTVRRGDVLVCEGGEVGRAAIWDLDEPMAYQKALHRLRVLDPSRDEPRFLIGLLRVARARGAFESGRVSTIEHLTGDQIRRHRFPWPPLAEQVRIAHAVEEVGAKLDRTRQHLRGEIDILQEFRDRLVADVVTGQLDVRALSRTLPEIDRAVTEADEFVGDDREIDDEAPEMSED